MVPEPEEEELEEPEIEESNPQADVRARYANILDTYNRGTYSNILLSYSNVFDRQTNNLIFDFGNSEVRATRPALSINVGNSPSPMEATE